MKSCKEIENELLKIGVNVEDLDEEIKALEREIGEFIFREVTEHEKSFRTL
ncbi:hypothetical protein J25TS5_04600 [Paenibacillus faecis]|uniref:hypothetical protein n=1 Tax=Paenibacillus faecis TaxID=862114 RepID=UPI001B180F9E|nr:hypothetical protein [Paenibacillus faecis]GIO83528.1 hypothetical protein J25TS5_04600 [Paenibacillus faecis]